VLRRLLEVKTAACLLDPLQGWWSEFLSLNLQHGAAPSDFVILLAVVSMACQLIGYYLYGKHVLRGSTKPNLASWGMWFFGAVVDLVTYESIEGSHWTANASPFASSLGVLGVSIVIAGMMLRSSLAGQQLAHQRLERGDKYFVLFDVTAALAWIKGHGTLGNFISVGTTVFQFFPMYRETYREPGVERVGPWAWWSTAYAFMLVAVAAGPGWNSPALYFLPAYYLLLHAAMIPLCLRGRPLSTDAALRSGQ
jgi:hypothetical protein